MSVCVFQKSSYIIQFHLISVSLPVYFLKYMCSYVLYCTQSISFIWFLINFPIRQHAFLRILCDFGVLLLLLLFDFCVPSIWHLFSLHLQFQMLFFSLFAVNICSFQIILLHINMVVQRHPQNVSREAQPWHNTYRYMYIVQTHIYTH